MKKTYKDQEDRVLYYAHVDMCITVYVCMYTYTYVHKLVIHVNKTIFLCHTHTNTFFQTSRIWVPLRLLAELGLLGQHKPGQGEESGTQPSSCESIDSSSTESDGFPVLKWL